MQITRQRSMKVYAHKERNQLVESQCTQTCNQCRHQGYNKSNCPQNWDHFVLVSFSISCSFMYYLLTKFQLHVLYSHFTNAISLGNFLPSASFSDVLWKWRHTGVGTFTDTSYNQWTRWHHLFKQKKKQLMKLLWQAPKVG